MKQIRRYWVPFLVLLWCLFHITLVKTSELNPWKMGGYGMYSDYHTEDYFVWLVFKKNKRLLANHTELFQNDPNFKNLVYQCRTFPSDSNLKELADDFKKKSGKKVNIEVWRLDFISDSLKLKRVLVNDY
ncbi:hypothetical protein [Flagellimonas nanhaiensis]|uniref:Uncharacterized protein n=1 Tax=Flagellimonas nanhaiensis TaxID=2292706 RepID=A0A371JKR8_9FLAO|nr:hypothetical protein [Allomuricauda nanhaiensis]RDY57557.1 hypothetical protein DX873_18660 [Allomuricauda nanhaiensis]